VRELLRNAFSAGFSEEFLFRGALMSRLTRVVPTGWALFAQASLFGLWHYGAATYAAKGNVTLRFRRSSSITRSSAT